MAVQLGPEAFQDLEIRCGPQGRHEDIEFRRFMDKQRLWLGRSSVLVPRSMVLVSSPRSTRTLALEGSDNRVT